MNSNARQWEDRRHPPIDSLLDLATVGLDRRRCPLRRGWIQRVGLHGGGLALGLAHPDRGDQQDGRNRPREAGQQTGELAELLGDVAVRVPAHSHQVPPHQAVDGSGQKSSGDVVPRRLPDSVHRHIHDHPQEQPGQPIHHGHAVVVEDQERHRFLLESRVLDPAGVPVPGLKTIQRCH